MGTPAPQITPTDNRIANWPALARCRTEQVPSSLFFSEDLGEIATAKRVCAACPVMAECLEQAIVNQEPFGVWGGLTEQERARVQRTTWATAPGPRRPPH